MNYELIMTYKDGAMKKETATLPAIMTALGIYTEDNSWVYIQIMNCQTGEILTTWENSEEYGVGTI